VCVYICIYPFVYKLDTHTMCVLVFTNVCINILDESGTSGSIDGADNESTQATGSRVRLLDSDPMVLHALPSAVSDDGKAYLLCTYVHMYV